MAPRTARVEDSPMNRNPAQRRQNQMFPSKIRTVILGAAASSVLLIPGAPSASASMILQRSGTVVQTHLVTTKVTTDQFKEAGGVGKPGYDDAECESLLGDYNKAVDESEGGLLEGNDDRANTYGELANRIYGQMSSNCLLVD